MGTSNRPVKWIECCVRVTDDVVGGIKAQQYTLDGWWWYIQEQME